MLILTDVREMGELSSEARKLSGGALKHLPFDRVAVVFGTNKFVSVIIKLLIMGAGHQDDVKQFEDEAKAREWLRAYKS